MSKVLPDKFRIIHDTIALAARRGLVHLDAEDETLDGRHVTVRGRRQISFGSCSYVGLETDRRLKESACDAVRRFGVQFACSRAYISSPLYGTLEELLERMFGAPVTIAQTTSLAHFAALPVLIDRGDAVLVDQFVHMSVQAVLPTLREAGVSCSMLRHNRMDRLREQITALGKQYRRVWYLADGVYSMSGGAAPMGVLRELLAQHTSLHLYIDDAHGMSWTGRHGRGHALGVEGIHPRMVVALSLAKAFSASGAALVFADRELARLVRTCGSTMIFSGPLQPALLGAAIASAHIHLSDEIVERQFLLRERIELFNTLARERGLSLASDAASPVRFVEIGPEEVTCRIGEVLMNAGYYTNIAMYPAVPKRRAGIRIAITLHQTLEDIRNLVDRLGDLCSRTNVA